MVAYMALRLRDRPGGLSLGLLMIAIAIWSGTLGFEVQAETIAAKILWSKFEYFGITSTPVLLLFFALSYTRQKKSQVSLPAILLWVIPLTTLFLAFTNEWHHLIWADFVPTPGTTLIRYEHGTWFWIMAAYAYGILLAVSVLFFQAALKSKHFFRSQALVLILSMISPWATNLFYILKLGQIPLDLTPIGFTITGVLLAWSLSRQQLLNIQPIARDHVIESMDDAVLVLDKRHRVVDLNSASRQVLSAPNRRMIGRPLTAFISEPTLMEHLENNVDNDIHTSLTLTSGPEKRHYDVQISTLRNRQQIQGHVVLMHDVTSREQLIDELDAFAHTVAHDLKSPINVILGYADLLQDALGNRNDELASFATAIGQTAIRSTHIIDELLLLASVRQQEVIHEPLNMELIMAKVQARVGARLEAMHGRLTMPPAWPTGLGYAPWVEEVWVNYVSNALKYGGIPPHVEVGATPLPDDGQVRFWVRDNGAGLTSVAQARLFTPFTRLEQDRAEGTGLGLSIVKRIVEKLGGEVGVESVAGEGSMFWFTLSSARTDVSAKETLDRA